jgi:hypothetical protein
MVALEVPDRGSPFTSTHAHVLSLNSEAAHLGLRVHHNPGVPGVSWSLAPPNIEKR